MPEETRAALRRWVRLFNSGEYFEAHEALEGAWLAATEPEKTFLKGLIHAAVALYHYHRGNAHGARVKYQSCLRYLSAYAPAYAGLDLESLLRDMEAYFAALLSQPPGIPPPEPAAPLPRARFQESGSPRW